MRAFKAILRMIIGLLFGAICALALLPVAAAFLFTENASPNLAMVLPWAIILACGVLALFASTIRKAFARGFLAAGLCIMALPLSWMFYSQHVSFEKLQHFVPAGPEAPPLLADGIGKQFAAAALTGISAVIGLFLGLVFCIIGLALLPSKQREIVILDPREPTI